MKKLFFLLFIFFISCAPMETLRVLDLTLEPFKTKGKIYTKTFEMDKDTAFAKTIDIFEKIPTKIYRKSKKKEFLVITNFNKVFTNCIETTDVAIFFTSENNKTKIEVSSLNYPLSEFAANILWKEFESL